MHRRGFFGGALGLVAAMFGVRAVKGEAIEPVPPAERLYIASIEDVSPLVRLIATADLLPRVLTGFCRDDTCCPFCFEAAHDGLTGEFPAFSAWPHAKLNWLFVMRCEFSWKCKNSTCGHPDHYSGHGAYDAATGKYEPDVFKPTAEEDVQARHYGEEVARAKREGRRGPLPPMTWVPE